MLSFPEPNKRRLHLNLPQHQNFLFSLKKNFLRRGRRKKKKQKNTIKTLKKPKALI